jgi:ABC-2 type transport system ATP-binding protein
MDEAKHCSRVGFMHSGCLLAFDSHHDLKKDYLQGAAWGLDVNPLLEAVEILSGLPGIVQARLHGYQAQVIVSGEWTPESLTAHLSSLGLIVSGIETVEPTLEDVFTLLAHQ